MNRIDARAIVLSALEMEREWQEHRFSAEHDDSTVHADLNHMVSVLSKYLGELAAQAVNQAIYKPVNMDDVATACIKIAAVATAIAESLVATDRVSPDGVENVHQVSSNA